MDWITLFTLTPILVTLFYIGIAIFILWFMLNFLKVQKEKNKILQRIANHLEKTDLEHLENSHPETIKM